VLSANTGDFSSSVNAASHTVGTAFTANSTLVNAVALSLSTNVATIGTSTYFVSNGNVGIGTTTPAAQLEVSTDLTVIATFTASITGITMTVTSVSGGTIAVGDLVFGVGVSPLTKITALGTGTGGVGTYTVSVNQTIPSTPLLQTSPNGRATIRLTDSGASTGLGLPAGTIEFFGGDVTTPGPGVGAYVTAFPESSSPDTALVFGTRDNLGVGVDANERMRITSIGAVGIGNTTPASKLVVSGNVDFRTANILLNGVVSGGYYKGNNSNTINQAAAGNIFRVNSNTLTASVTFAAGENGTATGPVAVGSGVSLTIQTGARVSIV
jgi:hypothetical protein